MPAPALTFTEGTSQEKHIAISCCDEATPRINIRSYVPSLLDSLISQEVAYKYENQGFDEF